MTEIQSAFQPNNAFRWAVSLPNVLSHNECDAIIEIANRQQKTHAVDVGNQDARDTLKVDLQEDDEMHFLFQRLRRVAQDANNRFYSFDIRRIGATQYLEYSYSGAKYDWHTDYARGNLSMRKLTIIFQLSNHDDYTGGDVQIQPGVRQITHTREKGSAIILTPFVLHRVTPIEAGTRCSVVSWILGPPFR